MELVAAVQAAPTEILARTRVMVAAQLLAVDQFLVPGGEHTSEAFELATLLLAFGELVAAAHDTREQAV